jgi:hypothetical protein
MLSHPQDADRHGTACHHRSFQRFAPPRENGYPLFRPTGIHACGFLLPMPIYGHGREIISHDQCALFKRCHGYMVLQI